MQLRAHHLLCIQNFRGQGYSQKFVTNMNKVITKIRNMPLELTDECDVICEPCPYNIEGVCSKDNVKDIDLQVLKKLNLRVGEIVELPAFVKRKLKKLQKEVCRDCEWKNLCM